VDPNPNERDLARSPVKPWRRLPVVLAFVAAACIAAGCGDDDAAGAPDISDITSDPAEYVGQRVELRGEVSEILRLHGGFLLDESDGGGDDLIVYDRMLPVGVTEGDEVQVEGIVRLIDDDFAKGVDDQFFDDLAFKDVKGQAAIDVSRIVDPTAPAPATAAGFGTLDANGDSYLDDDEIRESADADSVFDSWNADADSELDRDQIPGNAFRLWDRDGNKKISEEEWRSGTELWYPEDVDVVVFDDADGDGDSELDADEFDERFDVSALGEAWTPPAFDRARFKRAYFSLYDTNDDGRVSKDEWEYGATAFGTPAD
jgi:hypothetical protein